MSAKIYSIEEVDDLFETIEDLRSERAGAHEEIKALQVRLDNANRYRISLALDLAAARAACGDDLIAAAVRYRLQGVIDELDQVTVVGVGEDGRRKFKIVSGKAVDVTADDIASELRSLLKDTAAKAGEKPEAFKGNTSPNNPWLKTAGSPYGNITEQMRLLKHDPALAARLQAEADAAQAETAPGQRHASIPELNRLAQAGDKGAARKLKAAIEAKIAERSRYSTGSESQT